MWIATLIVDEGGVEIVIKEFQRDCRGSFKLLASSCARASMQTDLHDLER